MSLDSDPLAAFATCCRVGLKKSCVGGESLATKLPADEGTDTNFLPPAAGRSRMLTIARRPHAIFSNKKSETGSENSYRNFNTILCI